jgi:thioredoxin-dependent peroxiredoxin
VTTTDELLGIGDAAPDFRLPDATGRMVGLRDFAGHRVVVYFYPAAMTPGCTVEACDFRDHDVELDGLGVAVVGISRDDGDRLAEFAHREALRFPLLSDVDRQIHRRYGVLGTKLVEGKQVEKVRRSTFVIGSHGRIEWVAYDVQAAGHVADLAQQLRRADR